MSLRCTPLVACVLLGAAACSGSSSPSPRPGICSVQGTIFGRTFDAVDCFSRPETYASSSPVSGELHITTFGSACSKDEAQVFRKGSGVILMIFNSMQLTPGTYTEIDVCSANPLCFGASVTFYDTSDQCMVVAPTPTSSTGGSVVITKASPDGIKGTFDLMFGSDHLTGSFDAPTCGPSGPPLSWSCQ